MSWIRDSLKSGPALNLAAGYFCFASTAAYGFASLPVAVHFLDKEQIGLWNLISQVVAYLLFLEMGVGAAVGRMLAEPLASRCQNDIDRTWSTVIGILGVQSLLILFAGWLLQPCLIGYFKIPPDLAAEAGFLWLGMTVLHATAFIMRAYTGVLLCQERYHWTLIISGFTPWIQLAAFAALLAFGASLRSYVFATLLVNLCQFFWLRKLIREGPHHLRFRPASVTWQNARPILGYSFSMMLWSIAPAVFASIPAMVIGRSLGLEQVTIYVVSSRVPLMVAMLALRGFHAFFPKLQNLFVLGHRERFIRFYRLATSFSLLMTGAGLLLAMFANRHVVGFLARDDFYAGHSVTLWFALGFVAIAVSEHLGSLFIIAGKGKLVSFVLAVEILITFGAASALSPHFGLPGVAAALALTPLLVRIPYYLIYGPRTCSFLASELYGNASLALAASILMVAGAYLLLQTNHHSAALPLGMLFTLLAILPASICFRHLWRDFKELKEEKPEILKS